MTDRIRTLHTQADALLSRLAAHALEDQAAEAYPSSSDGPYVSSSAVSSPTETSGTRNLHVTIDDEGKQHIQSRLHQAGDYQLVERAFAQVVSLLTRIEERTTPFEATGEQCPTVAIDPDTRSVAATCQRVATHRSTGRLLCDRCDDWFRKPQNRGFHPGPEWIEDGNRQVVRWCACGPDCCPRDGQGHTSCTDRAEEGRMVSERCRNRMASPKCRCGPECCPDGCDDLPADRRTVSERCSRRQTRARANQ